MVFKFSKNTIYKGKLHRKDDEIDTNDAVSLAERGFGTIINENVDDTAAPGEDETNTEDTTAPGEDETNAEDTTAPGDDETNAEDTTAPGDDETNAEDTTAPGEDETNVDDKKSVSQSTAKKKEK